MLALVDLIAGTLCQLVMRQGRGISLPWMQFQEHRQAPDHKLHVPPFHPGKGGAPLPLFYGQPTYLLADSITGSRSSMS